jgi:hypothetical protein
MGLLVRKSHYLSFPWDPCPCSADYMQGTRQSFRTKEDAIHFAEKQGAFSLPIALARLAKQSSSLFRLGLLRVSPPHLTFVEALMTAQPAADCQEGAAEELCRELRVQA